MAAIMVSAKWVWRLRERKKEAKEKFNFPLGKTGGRVVTDVITGPAVSVGNT